MFTVLVSSELFSLDGKGQLSTQQLVDETGRSASCDNDWQTDDADAVSGS